MTELNQRAIHAPMLDCVDVDIEKSLPEEIQINMVEWNHLQALDYAELPFKCNFCHEFGHFSKRSLKTQETEALLNQKTNPPSRQEQNSSK